MQELIDYFIDNHGYLTGDAFLKKAQSLLDKEKQQIIEAYNDAIENHENASIKETAEQYYAKNYAS